MWRFRFFDRVYKSYDIPVYRIPDLNIVLTISVIHTNFGFKIKTYIGLSSVIILLYVSVITNTLNNM